jgi:hypothetical protein
VPKNKIQNCKRNAKEIFLCTPKHSIFFQVFGIFYVACVKRQKKHPVNNHNEASKFVFLHGTYKIILFPKN